MPIYLSLMIQKNQKYRPKVDSLDGMFAIIYFCTDLCIGEDVIVAFL